MALYDGVKIEIICNDRPCPMYDDPDADGHEDPFNVESPPQKYIEAVTGASFAIAVTLELHFRFAGCDGVRVHIQLDGTHRSYKDITTKHAIERSPQQRTAGFGCVKCYCPQTKQYRKGDMTFGKVKMRETIDSNVAMDEIKDLGQLKILWQRTFFGKETVQEHYGHDTKTISEVSEKVLKGRAIENAIQFGKLRPMAGKSTFTHVQAIPLPGLLGRQGGLNILYRSKRILQMLGCIPRTPSPIPQNSRVEEAMVKTDDPQEELRALRARVAELENRTSSTPQPRIKSEQHRSTSKVKREREDKVDDVKPRKIRTSGRTEVVDLTAD